MPELPEVETIVRTLGPHVTGRRIAEARILSPLAAAGRPAALAARLTGRLIHALRRRGKFIVFHLDDGVLCVHLRMTGKLLLDAAPGKFTRAVLDLDSATLLFDDVRQFGRMSWSKALPPNVARLGPEPFDLTPPAFAERLKARRGRVKPLLLNQAFLAASATSTSTKPSSAPASTRLRRRPISAKGAPNPCTPPSWRSSRKPSQPAGRPSRTTSTPRAARADSNASTASTAARASLAHTAPQ